MAETSTAPRRIRSDAWKAIGARQHPARLATCVAGVALFAIAAFAPANATVITFNELPTGTIVTNQYANVGALFSVSGSSPAVIVINTDPDVADNANISPSTPVLSGPNGLRILSGAPFSDILYVDFVDPSSTVAATTTSVSFSFVSDLPGFGSIRAFDAQNNEIDSAVSLLGGTGNDGMQAYETLTVTGTAIRRVAIDGFSDVIIDQIEFAPLDIVGVPEPATLGLFGLGLAGLGLAARRRNTA